VRNQLLARLVSAVFKLLLLPRLARALSRQLLDQGDYLLMKACNDINDINYLHGQRALKADTRAC